MTIKKKWDSLIKEVKLFETKEIQDSRKALNQLEELRFGKEITGLLESIVQKEYTNQPGVLANLFLSYEEYCQTTPLVQRETIEGIQVKYGLYLENIIKKKKTLADPWDRKCYIERETAIILLELTEQKSSQYTDLYNGIQMIECQGENIRYCPLWKKWLIWDGIRWEKAESNGIFPLAISTIKGFYEKAAEAGNVEDALALMEHASRSESCRKIEAMVRAATWDTRIWIQPGDLDRDNFLLNCQNGILDLKSGRFHETMTLKG